MHHFHGYTALLMKRRQLIKHSQFDKIHISCLLISYKVIPLHKCLQTSELHSIINSRFIIQTNECSNSCHLESFYQIVNFLYIQTPHTNRINFCPWSKINLFLCILHHPQEDKSITKPLYINVEAGFILLGKFQNLFSKIFSILSQVLFHYIFCKEIIAYIHMYFPQFGVVQSSSRTNVCNSTWYSFMDEKQQFKCVNNW